MKAQTYSLITIILVVPLMLYITSYLPAASELNYNVMERILSDQLCMVERSIEQDFSKAVEISGKRAFIAATGDVISKGVSLDDAIPDIIELMTNGSLYGNETIVMYNNTIYDWNEKIKELNIEYIMELKQENLTASNSDGMNVHVTMRFIINITDKLSTARITRDFYKTTIISLEDIEDPLFPLNTGGYVSRSMREHPYPYHAIKIDTGTNTNGNCIGNVTFDSSDPLASERILVINDSSGISGFKGVVSENTVIPSVSCYVLGISNATDVINYTINSSGYNEIYLDNQTNAVWSLPINDAIENGYYTKFNESGPDIFKRLEGKITSSVNGFETFVNIPKFLLADVPIKPGQVSLAYLYFSDSVYSGVPVRGISINHDWFRVNNTIAARYNLTELMT